jgi:hypothetical protein
MGQLNPYLAFFLILFVLILIPATLGLTETFRNAITDFTFVPMWQQRCPDEAKATWYGPTGYPIEAGPRWNYVGYVEESFSPNMDIFSRPAAANLIDDGTEFQKDASQLTMSAGNPKMNVKSPMNNEDDVMTYPLNGPAPDPSQANYELLNGVLKATPDSGISNVNARSCYATNFERQLEKTGNFRQFTNNYQHGYPDSCSAPLSELVLSFYKSDGISVPSKGECFKMGVPTYR